MISTEKSDDDSQVVLLSEASGENDQNPIIDLVFAAILFISLELFSAIILAKLSLISYIGVRRTVETALLICVVTLLNSRYPLALREYDKRLVLRFALIGIILCFIRYIPYFILITMKPRVTTVYATYLNLSGLHFVWSLFWLIVVAPLTEELVFRGYFFRLLQLKTSMTSAVVVSSLIFAAGHGIQAGWFMSHFLLGVFCCYVYTKSNSVWASVLTHMGNNAIWYFGTGFLINKF